MTKNEFNEAFKIAKDFNIDLTNVDNSNLYGCGLPHFRYPVYTTLEAVAALIRWQAMRFDGQWDAEALDEVAQIGRKKFLVLGA